VERPNSLSRLYFYYRALALSIVSTATLLFPAAPIVQSPNIHNSARECRTFSSHERIQVNTLQTSHQVLLQTLLENPAKSGHTPFLQEQRLRLAL
jgi:hypothetical protein